MWIDDKTQSWGGWRVYDCQNGRWWCFLWDCDRSYFSIVVTSQIYPSAGSAKAISEWYTLENDFITKREYYDLSDAEGFQRWIVLWEDPETFMMMEFL